MLQKFKLILKGYFFGFYSQEVDELCDEWVPEPLIPPITEEMKYEPPVLERWISSIIQFLSSLIFFGRC